MRHKPEAAIYFKCSAAMRQVIEDEARRNEESLSHVVRRILRNHMSNRGQGSAQTATAHG
jgi:hypothetical protein